MTISICYNLSFLQNNNQNKIIHLYTHIQKIQNFIIFNRKQSITITFINIKWDIVQYF